MQTSITNSRFPALKKFGVLAMFMVFIILSSTVKSQSSDTSKVIKHSQQKAAFRSAIIPGLGQAYNKKYWKIPIIYAGAAAVTYFAILNGDSLNNYTTAYRLRTDGDSATNDAYVYKYSTDNLLTIKNFYRRNLELTFIVGFAIYALNIIDATVDAYLFDFDINDNLTMNIHPLFTASHQKPVTGLTLTFNIGKVKKTQQFKN